MRYAQFAPRGRVVNAQRLPRLIDAIQTIGRTYARADVVLTPFHNLLDDMRIRHMRAGHAHHIQQPRLHRMACRSYIRDSRRMKGRHASGFLDLSGKVQMRRTCHTLHRDHISHCRVCMYAAADHVQKIKLPRRG